jgi:hypothetical protein
LQREGVITGDAVQKAIADMGIDPDKPNPAVS